MADLNPHPAYMPRCACGHLPELHEVKGQGAARKYRRCSNGHGPKGTPCGCPQYSPAATS